VISPVYCHGSGFVTCRGKKKGRWGRDVENDGSQEDNAASTVSFVGIVVLQP